MSSSLIVGISAPDANLNISFVIVKVNKRKEHILKYMPLSLERIYHLFIVKSGIKISVYNILLLTISGNGY